MNTTLDLAGILDYRAKLRFVIDTAESSHAQYHLHHGTQSKDTIQCLEGKGQGKEIFRKQKPIMTLWSASEELLTFFPSYVTFKDIL